MCIFFSIYHKFFGQKGGKSQFAWFNFRTVLNEKSQRRVGDVDFRPNVIFCEKSIYIYSFIINICIKNQLQF